MSERDGFLSRWSRRKHDAAAGRVADEPVAASPAAASAGDAAPLADAARSARVEPLPPVESLTAESDFTPFMAKDVDPQLKRSALKKLFDDERFNVMDGLDVYIDDYTKPAPIPPEWYGRMAQLAGLGDVPAREAAEAAQAAQARLEERPPQGAGIAGVAPAATADEGVNTRADIAQRDGGNVLREGAEGAPQ